MAYSPTNWQDFPSRATPLNATNLNKLTFEIASQAQAMDIPHSLPTWTDGEGPHLTSKDPWTEIERVTELIAIALGDTYTKTTWSNGSSGRTATNLNKLEAQAEENRAAIDALTPITVNWYPGYYTLATAGASAETKQSIVDDTLSAPFTGYQFRYFWNECEATPGDWSAGFALVDADLTRIFNAGRGQKLLVMLQYKSFDDTAVVPSDMLTDPLYESSDGTFQGEMITPPDNHVAMIWNPNVSSRCQEWIEAMITYLDGHAKRDMVAGIVFNETSVSTSDVVLLGHADYDPDDYITGIQNNLLAVINNTDRFPAFYYHEGGFVDMGGGSVQAGTKMGNWMLTHPHTGCGTPDSKSLNPKTSTHPCANLTYQGIVPCNSDIQAGDYSTDNNASLQEAFDYMTQAGLNKLDSSYLSFSYGVGSSPAFTWADVSAWIPTHPVPNDDLPPGW